MSIKIELQDKLQNIAIIGVGLRLPGDLADMPSFWEALTRGADLVTQIDPSRWATDALSHPKRGEPGRSVTFSAGVLSRIDAFDAGFFGISPREAELLDPQQRLLLELAWEAMESAHIRPSTLESSDCGVYIGISGLDYGMRLLDDLSSMGAHSMTGNTLSIAANRLSYVFNLHGPSLAIDTACSSSLVALHQACTALVTGQTQVALVGGVNLLLHPYPFVGFTKASMLSAQGRCRAFAEGGDGYVRGEGAAMLLLKPLEQAEIDGDPILGVIRASGVNADGARKSGLTIPSSAAQAQLMRQVLERARLRPEEVDFIEAHGTGTRIGDPIEARAIGEVYGARGKREAPLPIGSVKSNLGHMEPASGMAGLLKALLALRHGVVPPSIHTQTLNPDIDFDALNLRVAQEPVALQDKDRPLRAGVNSFGFGGVNAHVILEAYRLNSSQTASAASPAGPPAPILLRHETPIPLILSARDDAALRTLAGRYVPLLQEADIAARTRIAQAAWLGRDWLDKRLALPDLRSADALDALRRFADGEEDRSIILETRPPGPGKLAFIYSGNGAQWVGMGRRLQAASAVFRASLQQAADAILDHGGPDVLQVLAAEQQGAMDDTALAQPALFAVQVATTQLLRSLGVDADAAAGHSVGEIAAAWATGALDLPAAAQVIVARSKAQALARGTGRMAAVGLGAEAMQQTLTSLGLDSTLEIAAVNSPRNVTVSGAKLALDVLHGAMRAQVTFYRELDLDYAFHSRLMDPIRPHIESDLARLAPGQNAAGVFYSTVTGAPVPASALDAAYWWRNVREPVLFGPTLARMAEDGYCVFLEIGPHAVLQRYIDEALQGGSATGRALFTARRDADDLPDIERAALRAALLDTPIRPSAYFPSNLDWKQVQLPNYPWQRQRYWAGHTAEGYALIERHLEHPLLGYRLKEQPAAWENHLDPIKLPWLADHQVGGAVILPGAAYLELALAAAHAWQPDTAQVAVDRLEILSPVVFDGEHAQTLRVILDPTNGRVRIEGRRRLSFDAWALHARCQIRISDSPRTHAPVPIAETAAPAHVIDGAQLYALASALGLDYGPAFRGLRTIQADDHTLHAELGWADGAEPAPGYVLHPAVLDQCFQATFAWFEAELHAATRPMAFLPVGMECVTLHQTAVAERAARLRARLVRRSPHSVVADFELLDADDAVLVQIQGVRFRAAALTAPQTLPPAWAETLRLTPIEVDPVAETPAPPLSVLAAAVESGFDRASTAPLKHYAEELAPLVDALPGAFARDALQKLAQADGVIPAERVHHLRCAHPLWNWSLQTLEQEGLLQRQGGDWQLHPEELPPTAAIWQSALMECPQAWPEWLRMARVGESLMQLARPDFQPDDKLAASVPPEPALPWYAAAHQAADRALRELIKQWPRQHRLRVLEVSNADSSLLDSLRATDLPQDGMDFVRACPSEAQTARLRAQAEASARLITRFDPESLALDPIDGLPERFDVMLLDQVLHTLADPMTALGQLTRLMAPDAVLMLSERWPDRASNLLHGLSPGWWHEHDGHTTSSLMPPAAWTQALQSSGWQDVQELNDPIAGAAGLGSFVLLARAPARIETLDPIQTDGKSAMLRVADPAWQTLADEVAAALIDVRLPGDNTLYFPALPPPCAPAAQWAEALDAVRRTLLQAAALEKPPCVWLITAGGPQSNPAAAALWGVVRVLRNEAPHLSLRLLAAPQPADASPARALAARIAHAVLHDDGEDEIVLTAEGRYAPRIRPVDLAALPSATQSAPPAEAWRLDFTLPGQLRNLHWQPPPAPRPPAMKSKSKRRSPV